ncbi:anti-sigma factor family protein [Blastopirellula retiformator]|uniref:Putative zinc-finger domain-containing protein n=1 Tax=Blastopirellula retiformator TaxID=2527970 RepID=A0A5C5UZ72_9BACT|nr:zf-HC2 domain-containing protein [Blastopirellula retiformator]TWT30920.1 hypothetical protein Enr8_44460 [Blastopirellula retiformator]
MNHAKLSCKEIYEYLADFLDNALPNNQQEVMETHLEHCPCCKHYLDNYRETLVLGKAACCNKMNPPPPAPDALINAILAARQQGEEKTPPPAE